MSIRRLGSPMCWPGIAFVAGARQIIKRGASGSLWEIAADGRGIARVR
jgi:hypothetical protein